MINNKKKIYYIFGAIIVFTIVYQNQQQLAFANNPTSSSLADTQNMKSIIDNSINNATYYTFENATTPSIGIDNKTNTIYSVYFKNETQGGNLYLQKSEDMGKTFSAPVRINKIDGSINVDEQWSAPGLGIGQNSDIHGVV